MAVWPRKTFVTGIRSGASIWRLGGASSSAKRACQLGIEARRTLRLTEHGNQGRTSVPRGQWAVCCPLDQVLADRSADRHVGDLGCVEAALRQEGLDGIDDELEALFIIVDLKPASALLKLAAGMLLRTASILFTATTSCCTPRLRTRMACSRVWPRSPKPDSKPPFDASTTSTAASACAAPEIMLGMKSR
jgi:hypothetical protein